MCSPPVSLHFTAMSSPALREIAYDSPEYQQSVALRYFILRQPIHLTFTPADLEDDKTDIHLAAFDTTHTDDATNSQLVATLILHPITPPVTLPASATSATRQPADTQREQPVIKMRQVAVAAHTQGRGVGRKLVSWSEEVARSRGYGLMRLNARETAVGFYTTLGYHCVGEGFIEVGIAHQKMEKQLT